jgi:glycosyltransferase involved in cell wall biosynthesis
MENKITVLYPMTGSNMGGSHIVFDIFVNNIPAYINPVIFLKGKGAFSSYLDEKKIKYYVLPEYLFFNTKKRYFHIALSFIAGFFYFLKVLKKHNIDIVQVSDDPLVVPFCFFSYLSNSPYIWFHHNKITQTIWHRICLKLTKHHIFASYYLRELSGFYNSCVILNPLKLSRKQVFRNSVENEIKIGYFSNFYKRKRPFFFIDLIKQLNLEGINAYGFIFGGDGEITSSDLIRYIEDEEIEKNITISGFQHNIEEKMLEMDYIIAPAVDEPFGRILIESFSLNVPALASNDAGHIEIMKDFDNYFLFKKDSLKDCVDKIKFLIKNPEVQKKVTESVRKKVLLTYKKERHIEKILDYYKKLQKKHG